MTGWYDNYYADAALYGDLEAERKWFGHENLTHEPRSLIAAMRTRDTDPTHGLALTAFIDCLLEKRPFSPLHKLPPPAMEIAA